jgi:hypothetical protein
MGADTPRPADAGSRGPLRTFPPRRPTGYRVDEQRRLELEAAMFAFGAGSLQAVLDQAVDEYLRRKRRSPDFQAALALKTKLKG